MNFSLPSNRDVLDDIACAISKSKGCLRVLEWKELEIREMVPVT